MDAIRPTSIRADQWNTIADDVKAGRCKATFESDNGYHIDLLHEKRERLCFEYRLPIGSEVESGVIGLEPGDVITLEWQDKPTSEASPNDKPEMVMCWECRGTGMGSSPEQSCHFCDGMGMREADNNDYRMMLNRMQDANEILHTENQRLQAELDAANQRAAGYRAALLSLKGEMGGDAWIADLETIVDLALGESETKP